MAPASTKNYSALPAGKFCKSDKRSTVRGHKANQGKSGVEAERERALGAFHSLRFKNHHSAGLRSDIQFFDKEEKNKGIQEFVEKEMAAARQRVAKAEVAVERERERAEDMEMKRLAAGPTKMCFREMMEAMGENVEDVMTSDEDGDDEEEDDEDDKDDAKLSDDDDNEHERNWVVGTINQSV
jgi:hypothetical protein